MSVAAEAVIGGAPIDPDGASARSTHDGLPLSTASAGSGTIDRSLLAGKHMLVVEEALKGESGHWYEYVKAVAELNAAAGAATTVITHVDTDPAVIEELGTHAIFRWTSWDNIYRYPQAWRRYYGVVLHNFRVYRTMSRFLQRHGPFDIVFAPTVVIFHIFAWRLLMTRFGGRKVGQIILLFRNNAGSYKDDSNIPIFKRSTRILAWAMRSFGPLLRSGQARFATDSVKLAHEYRMLCGIEPEVFLSPKVAAPAPATPIIRDAAAPVTFSCLGPARFEKGIDLLQGAIRGFFALCPGANVRFVIQWNEPIVDTEGRAYLPDPALIDDARVDLVTQPMTSVQYEARIAASDCMLLPYRRASYFARISGVAVEAVTAGLPVIYTTDTWNEELVRDMGAGIGVADGDVAGLVGAIAKIVADHGQFVARARARAQAARQSHSAAAFVAGLWGQA